MTRQPIHTERVTTQDVLRAVAARLLNKFPDIGIVKLQIELITDAHGVRLDFYPPSTEGEEIAP